MESRSEDRPAASSPMGGEFRSLKEHGTATVDELRDFLVKMRGKSAREMLGTLAESGLVKATVQATLATIVLLGAFTAGPYLLGAGNGRAKPAANAAPAAGSTAAGKPSAPGESSDNKSSDGADGLASVGSGDAASVPTTDLERAAKKMGIGETKTADPKVNPLDKDLDSLLDKVK